MQRDIGNEFIVAIVAVGVLAFAIAFAIILSLSGGAGQTPTPSPKATDVIAQALTQIPSTLIIREQTAESTPTITSTATTIIVASSTPTIEKTATQIVLSPQPKTAVPTATIVKPTNTASAVQAIAASDTLSPTRTPAATKVALQPTVTQKPSATSPLTLAPTLTSTVRPTIAVSATPTRPQPSATPTATASRTALPATATFTATSTSTIKPSATTTKTATSIPSLTPTVRPTLTRTPTPLPPSATVMPTMTATRVPTKTLPPPSAVPTLTMTATLVSSAAPCTIPAGWVSYKVRRGDTLLSIAQKAGTTIEVLQEANCVANINTIFVGQILSVPAQPNTTGNVSYVLEGCTDAGTLISNLSVGQLISGLVRVEGTATVNNFAFYKLEIRPDSSKAYTLYNSYIKPVTQGVLGEIDTRIFSPGIYWLKLTVITQNSQATPSCAVPLLFAQQN